MRTCTSNFRRSSAIPENRTKYQYDNWLDGRIGRLSYLADQAHDAPSTHIEEYAYLGLNTVVTRNRPSGNSRLSYVKQAGESNGDGGDQYTGIDRFGRIIDQRWTGLSGTNVTTIDRFGYGYDANSNPLYKDNRVNSSFSELYHANGASAGYDPLDRLTDFRRGTLSDANADGTPDTVSTLNTLAGSQKNWTLDALGNWSSSTTDGTSSTRAHNAQNELTQVGGANLSFDNAGNTTVDETGQQYVYDAWNHVVTVKDASNVTIQSYAYDAAGRRTRENAGTATDLYYSDAWQVLKERQGGIPQTQYVWSPTYVDELICRDQPGGNVDTGFDGDGMVVTSVSQTIDQARSLAIQPDGKVVVGGFAHNGTDSDFALVRYNADGSLDTSFDSDGIVTTDLGADDFAYALILQSNGKIVLAGHALTWQGENLIGDFAVVRYNSDGSLDTSFGSNGIVISDLDNGSDDRAYAVMIASGGDIVVAGGLSNDAAMARYDSTGALQGVTTGLFGATPSIAFSAATQSDGMLILGGEANGNHAIARVNSYGALDDTFGTSVPRQTLCNL